MTKYYNEWYRKNKERHNEKRRKKYHNNEKYKKKALENAKKYYYEHRRELKPKSVDNCKWKESGGGWVKVWSLLGISKNWDLNIVRLRYRRKKGDIPKSNNFINTLEVYTEEQALKIVKADKLDNWNIKW